MTEQTIAHSPSPAHQPVPENPVPQELRAARRTLSGIKPTGHMHLGNFLGAVSRWTDPSYAGSLFFIADLHAFTVEHQPVYVRAYTREMFALLIATGIDPQRTTVFVQSDVPAHTELTYLLECTASFGEMRRMIQFKEKSAGRDSVRLSLLTYPALMAADILLYDALDVPVADDQNQHVELARDLARRFNHRYGETFVVPQAVLPKTATRVRDLQDPNRKMEKSAGDRPGTVYLLDSPDVINTKVRKAVTDTEATVRYDPETKPGVSNLLEILAAATGTDPVSAAAGLTSYSGLKQAVSDAVIDALAPVQAKYAELVADPAALDALREQGAERARSEAAPTLHRARRAIGLGV